LSDKRKGESGKSGKRGGGSDKGGDSTRKRRPSDLGRALRSIYDDTLREPVPDDFLNLIGKLS